MLKYKLQEVLLKIASIFSQKSKNKLEYLKNAPDGTCTFLFLGLPDETPEL